LERAADRFIAAYIVGGYSQAAISADAGGPGGYAPQCRRSRQTGCYVSANLYASQDDGAFFGCPGEPLISADPPPMQCNSSKVPPGLCFGYSTAPPPPPGSTLTTLLGVGGDGNDPQGVCRNFSTAANCNNPLDADKRRANLGSLANVGLQPDFSPTNTVTGPFNLYAGLFETTRCGPAGVLEVDAAEPECPVGPPGAGGTAATANYECLVQNNNFLDVNAAAPGRPSVPESPNIGDLHSGDYNAYWLNWRLDVKRRVDAFCRKNRKMCRRRRGIKW